MFCKAVTKDNKQCGRPANRDHCEDHFKTFYQLANEIVYIEGMTSADLDVISYYDVDQIVNIFNNIEEVIKLRIRYRNLAYAKEYYNEHNTYIIDLYKSMIKLMKIITDGGIDVKTRFLKIVKLLKEEGINDELVDFYHRNIERAESVVFRLTVMVNKEINSGLINIWRYKYLNPKSSQERAFFFITFFSMKLLEMKNKDRKLKIINPPATVSYKFSPYMLKTISKLIIYNSDNFWKFMSVFFDVQEEAIDKNLIMRFRIGLYREGKSRYAFAILFLGKRIKYNPLKITDWIMMEEDKFDIEIEHTKNIKNEEEMRDWSDLILKDTK